MNTNLQREAKKPPFFYSYLITDPKYYGTDPHTFQKKLAIVLEQHSVDILCFRDKTTQDIESLAKVCLEVSKKFNIPKVLINRDINLALKLGFDGVHLTSKQFNIITYAKQKGLYTLISTHSGDEVDLAKKRGADGVTFSPIFFTKNKGEPKGCEALQDIVNQFQENSFFIFALGGITTQENIEKIKETGARGFASISCFFE